MSDELFTIIPFCDKPEIKILVKKSKQRNVNKLETIAATYQHECPRCPKGAADWHRHNMKVFKDLHKFGAVGFITRTEQIDFKILKSSGKFDGVQ